jgi:hypothetical protein
MESLPIEVVEKILAMLPKNRHEVVAGMVCRLWRGAILRPYDGRRMNFWMLRGRVQVSSFVSF